VPKIREGSRKSAREGGWTPTGVSGWTLPKRSGKIKMAVSGQKKDWKGEAICWPELFRQKGAAYFSALLTSKRRKKGSWGVTDMRKKLWKEKGEGCNCPLSTYKEAAAGQSGTLLTIRKKSFKGSSRATAPRGGQLTKWKEEEKRNIKDRVKKQKVNRPSMKRRKKGQSRFDPLERDR